MTPDALIRTIAEIHTRSQETAGQALNRLLALRNWLIGAYIVEYEQCGEDRVAYGERLLHRLAAGLVDPCHRWGRPPPSAPSGRDWLCRGSRPKM